MGTCNNRNCSRGGVSHKYYADLRQSLGFRRWKLTIYEKEKKSALHRGLLRGIGGCMWTGNTVGHRVIFEQLGRIMQPTLGRNNTVWKYANRKLCSINGRIRLRKRDTDTVVRWVTLHSRTHHHNRSSGVNVVGGLDITGHRRSIPHLVPAEERNDSWWQCVSAKIYYCQNDVAFAKASI